MPRGELELQRPPPRDRAQAGQRDGNAVAQTRGVIAVGVVDAIDHVHLQDGLPGTVLDNATVLVEQRRLVGLGASTSRRRAPRNSVSPWFNRRIALALA